MWEWLWHWTCWVNKQVDGWMDENRLKKNMTWFWNWTYFGITRARGSFWWEVQEFSSLKNYLLPISFLTLCCYLTLQWWAQHTVREAGKVSWWNPGSHKAPLPPSTLSGFHLQGLDSAPSLPLPLPPHPAPLGSESVFPAQTRLSPSSVCGRLDWSTERSPEDICWVTTRLLLCSLRGASWEPERNTSVNGRVWRAHEERKRGSRNEETMSLLSGGQCHYYSLIPLEIFGILSVHLYIMSIFHEYSIC